VKDMIEVNRFTPEVMLMDSPDQPVRIMYNRVQCFIYYDKYRNVLLSLTSNVTTIIMHTLSFYDGQVQHSVYGTTTILLFYVLVV
jgi:hypothetical protein